MENQFSRYSTESNSYSLSSDGKDELLTQESPNNQKTKPQFKIINFHKTNKRPKQPYLEKPIKINYISNLGLIVDQSIELSNINSNAELFLSEGRSGSLFISRIRKIDFKIDHQLFEKGKNFNYKVPETAPDVKFWYQRFYYYSRFDEGIMMDYESILLSFT